MFLTSHSVTSHNLNSIQTSRQRTNMRLKGQVDWNQEKIYEESEDGDERPHNLSNLGDLFGTATCFDLREAKVFDHHFSSSSYSSSWNCTLCNKGPMNESDAEVHMNCVGHRSKRETLMSHIGDESITNTVGMSSSISGSWNCTLCSKGPMNESDAEVHMNCIGHRSKRETLISHIGDESITNTVGMSSSYSGSWNCTLCSKGPMNESDAEVHMNCSGHRSKRETLMSHIGDESITKAVGVKWHCRPCGTGAMTKKDANIHADSKRHKDIKSNAGPMTKFDSRIHVKSACHIARASEDYSARNKAIHPGVHLNNEHKRVFNANTRVRVMIQCKPSERVSLNFNACNEGIMLEVKITSKISKKHGIFPRQALGQVCQGLAAFKNANSGLSQTKDGYWKCKLCLTGIMTDGNATCHYNSIRHLTAIKAISKLSTIHTNGPMIDGNLAMSHL